VTIGDAWRAGREHLAAAGIDEAEITAEVLLRHALGLSRTDLYLAWDRLLPPDAWTPYHLYLLDRARGRPAAYIVGHREFMGLEFLVDERVLIPRPETEVLVETVLELMSSVAMPIIADIGTGSGAIAVSVAAFHREATVVATDISGDALDVARGNAARHGVTDRVRFSQGNLLEPLVALTHNDGRRFDALACNPPYVGTEAAPTLPIEIRDFEPAVAVLSGGSGDRFHAQLIAGAPAVLQRGGWLVMETSAGQAPGVVELLHRAGVYQAVHARRDGLGWDRVVVAQLQPAE
jgi:release factor glutamine methyltransferase